MQIQNSETIRLPGRSSRFGGNKIRQRNERIREEIEQK